MVLVLVLYFVNAGDPFLLRSCGAKGKVRVICCESCAKSKSRAAKHIHHTQTRTMKRECCIIFVHVYLWQWCDGIILCTQAKRWSRKACVCWVCLREEGTRVSRVCMIYEWEVCVECVVCCAFYARSAGERANRSRLLCFFLLLYVAWCVSCSHFDKLFAVCCVCMLGDGVVMNERRKKKNITHIRTCIYMPRNQLLLSAPK